MRRLTVVPGLPQVLAKRLSFQTSVIMACDETPSLAVVGLTACALTCILFIKSIYIQYPVVFGDETGYALQAKFFGDPRFDQVLPNILFFYVYHVASWFGRDHLIFSKFLNSTFFGFSLFPLYATARRFLSNKGAYLFGLAVLLSPVSSYSVYMMAEAMYFFVFWVVVYITVTQVTNNIVYGELYLGFALAALSTVKPQGLVIIGTVPIVLAGLYLQRRGEIPLQRLVGAAFACLMAFVAGRLIINYLAQGDFAISLVGKFYKSFLAPMVPGKHTILSPKLFHFIRGHLAYLGVLFWPAIMLALWPTKATDSRTGARSTAFVALRIFAFVTLGLLILITAKFSADIGEICRLHGRYYDFALPTLMLLFLARTAPDSEQRRWSAAFKIVVIFGALASSALAYSSALNYCPQFVDFPDLMGIVLNRLHIAFLIFGCIGSAACLAFSTRRVARVFYCAFIVVVAFAGSIEVFRTQRACCIVVPAEPDVAVIAVRNLIPGSQIDDGVVLAKTYLRASRAMFELYSLSEEKILDKPILTADDIPPGKKWALLLDHYAIDLPFYSEVRGSGFEFIQLAPSGIVGTEGTKLLSFPRRYDLSDKGERWISLSGFKDRDDWGVWTQDPTARIYLDAPVSGKLRIKIRGHAYGPAVGKPVEIKVGAVEQQAVFTSTGTEVEVIMDLPAPAFFLELSGLPPPIGIGLSEIQIDRY
jgi:hypothetical protein